MHLNENILYHTHWQLDKLDAVKLQVGYIRYKALVDPLWNPLKKFNQIHLICPLDMTSPQHIYVILD